MKKIIPLLLLLCAILGCFLTPSKLTDVHAQEPQTTTVAFNEEIANFIVFNNEIYSNNFKTLINNNIVTGLKVTFTNANNEVIYSLKIATTAMEEIVEHHQNYSFKIKTVSSQFLEFYEKYPEQPINFGGLSISSLRVDRLQPSTNGYINVENELFFAPNSITFDNSKNSFRSYESNPNVYYNTIAKIATKYNLTFLTTIGSATPSSFLAPENFIIDMPFYNPTGYTFNGWYYDNNLTNAITTPFVMPGNNVSLYAKVALANYTLTFNWGNLSPITAPFGAAITFPTPTNTGYTFVGWFTNIALTAPFTATTMPGYSYTLYPKWQANNYTITFVTNGGSELTPIQKAFLQTINKNNLPTPTRIGYTLLDWYLDEDLTQSLESRSMPATDLTLYAKWENGNPPTKEKYFYNLINKTLFSTNTDSNTRAIWLTANAQEGYKINRFKITFSNSTETFYIDITSSVKNERIVGYWNEIGNLSYSYTEQPVYVEFYLPHGEQPANLNDYNLTMDYIINDGALTSFRAENAAIIETNQELWQNLYNFFSGNGEEVIEPVDPNEPEEPVDPNPNPTDPTNPEEPGNNQLIEFIENLAEQLNLPIWAIYTLLTFAAFGWFFLVSKILFKNNEKSSE